MAVKEPAKEPEKVKPEEHKVENEDADMVPPPTNKSAEEPKVTRTMICSIMSYNLY